jgi:hypothetical protein
MPLCCRPSNSGSPRTFSCAEMLSVRFVHISLMPCWKIAEDMLKRRGSTDRPTGCESLPRPCFFFLIHCRRSSRTSIKLTLNHQGNGSLLTLARGYATDRAGTTTFDMKHCLTMKDGISNGPSVQKQNRASVAPDSSMSPFLIMKASKSGRISEKVGAESTWSLEERGGNYSIRFRCIKR